MSDDGEMCVCHRVESPHQAKSGHGWIHILVDRPLPVRRPVRAVSATDRVALFDAAYTMEQFREEFILADVFVSLEEIAKDLNLAAYHIDRLLVGRSAFHRAWAFPMLDGNGKCVGIRLREYGSSRKWSVAGSKDGLFYDPELKPLVTIANGLKGDELVIVEGATDTIAGYALGLPCVGRSSCGTGADALNTLLDRLQVKRITIVTDYDAIKYTPSGMPYRAGIDGAHKLAAKLGRAYRILTPPKKDLRDWYAAGLTPATFWQVANLQKWKRP